MNAPLRRCVGFDIDHRGNWRTPLSDALAASKITIAKVRRWKEAAQVWPATPAVGGFPYPHPTCAETRHSPKVRP